jgi:hypothetical protein
MMKNFSYRWTPDGGEIFVTSPDNPLTEAIPLGFSDDTDLAMARALLAEVAPGAATEDHALMLARGELLRQFKAGVGVTRGDILLDLGLPAL